MVKNAIVSANTSNPDLAGAAVGGRRLVAIVYADMVGYSRLIGLDDAGTLRRLRTLRRALIDPAIREHGGRVVQPGGDSLLVAFDSIDGAVRCAVKVQRQVPVYDGDHPPDRRIRFRIGINIGDVIQEGTNLHGDGVNIAARLEATSPSGGICVSRTVRDHVHGRHELAFEPIGTLTLKNITRPVEAFVLRLDTSAEASETAQRVLTSTTADVGLSNAPPLSLVVLPFDNLGGSGVEDYIVDGITEDLTTDLSRLPGFLVIARNSAFTYRGKPIDVKRVGEELGVRYAVEGSVRRAGAALRISAQLVSTETGSHLWADRFDVARDRIDDGVDDIVRHIVSALNARLLDIESTRSARERPGNPDAADILLRARALNNVPHNLQVHAELVELYERAVALDPSSATALAGLAEALLDSIVAWDEDPTVPGKLRRAEQLITQAELLRPDDMNVMWARVYLLGMQGRRAEVIPAAQRAIETYPNLGGPHLWMGICLTHAGRAEDAIPEFERAIRISPRSPYSHMRYLLLGFALVRLGRYDEAIPWLQKSLAIHPNNSARNRGNTYAAIAAAQALSGHLEEAHESAAEASRLWPTLTVRGYYQYNFTNPVNAAQMSRIRDGLRLAGVRDHVDEDAGSSIAPDDVLHTDYAAPTPKTAAGVRTIRTPELVALLEQRKPLVIDTTPWGKSIPGAIGLRVGMGGTIHDEYQERLGRKIRQLTAGDLTIPVVAMSWNAERYQGRNLAIRLVALGYTEVHWYRGGREAWEVAGCPETELIVQDW
jgi:TolB-like protein/class 3 adenylate cyclase/tetratricopeptide (TPR) repeat protein